MCWRRHKDTYGYYYYYRWWHRYVKNKHYDLQWNLSNQDLYIKETSLIRTLFQVLYYSGTSDKGPSEKGMTSLQRTLIHFPLP